MHTDATRPGLILPHLSFPPPLRSSPYLLRVPAVADVVEDAHKLAVCLPEHLRGRLGEGGVLRHVGCGEGG